MINFELFVFGSLTIVFPASIALIRSRRVHRSYQPFIAIILTSFANEITNYVLVYNGISNAVNTNLLSLAEGVGWCMQFYRWKAFGSRNQYRFVLSAVATVWLFENIVLGKLFTFSSGYSIGFSLLLVLLCINQVNRLIIEEKSKLLTNAKFLICSGNIIFSTYRIIVECFYLLDLDKSAIFLANIYAILAVVNVFVNLLLALATSWIPRRQKFTLPYSLQPAS